MNSNLMSIMRDNDRRFVKVYVFLAFLGVAEPVEKIVSSLEITQHVMVRRSHRNNKGRPV